MGFLARKTSILLLVVALQNLVSGAPAANQTLDDVSDIADPVSNLTTAAGDCCFIVQPTVYPRYWASYSTFTFNFSAQITSYVTSVTAYRDTTITRITSSIITTYTVIPSALDLGLNNLIEPTNTAYVPQTVNSEFNGTATRLYGSNIPSPTQFYVYPSVVAIHVPAVTGPNGLKQCTTTSTITERSDCLVSFYGFNSNVDPYFTYKAPVSVSFNVTESATTRATATGLAASTITFPTPIIYAPAFATKPVYVPKYTDEAGEVAKENIRIFSKFPRLEASTDTDRNVPWGHVPQSVVDIVRRDPRYASCIPGGPEILGATFCEAAAPVTQGEATELTSSAAFTETMAGCFNPEACEGGGPGGPTGSVEPDRPTPSPTAIPATTGGNPPQQTTEEPPPAESSPANDEPPPGDESPPDNDQPPADEPPPSNDEPPSNDQPPANDDPPSNNEPPANDNPPSNNEPPANNNPPANNEPPANDNSPTNNEPPANDNPPANNEPPADNQSPETNGSGDSQQGQAPAQPAAGFTVSVAPSGSAVVVNGQTNVVQPPSPTIASVGQTPVIAGGNGQAVVGDQTLSAGGPGTTIAGTPVSVAKGGSAIMVGSSSIPLPPSNTAVNGANVLTVGSETFTANSAGVFSMDGQTVSPGGEGIEVDGTSISLLPSGTAAVIDGTTQALGSGPPITVGGQTFAPNSNGDYVIGSQTIVPGGAGEVVSLTSSADTAGPTAQAGPSGSGAATFTGGAAEMLAANTKGGVIVMIIQVVILVAF